mmetsp:Transcript_79722/g.207110  ORF Transcript_79722/g.207110 Transcript_79722/m.207110 type:complete len:245 (-) Transcript_79722:109-843(-)
MQRPLPLQSSKHGLLSQNLPRQSEWHSHFAPPSEFTQLPCPLQFNPHSAEPCTWPAERRDAVWRSATPEPPTLPECTLNCRRASTTACWMRRSASRAFPCLAILTSCSAASFAAVAALLAWSRASGSAVWRRSVTSFASAAAWRARLNVSAESCGSGTAPPNIVEATAGGNARLSNEAAGAACSSDTGAEDCAEDCAACLTGVSSQSAEVSAKASLKIASASKPCQSMSLQGIREAEERFDTQI